MKDEQFYDDAYGYFVNTMEGTRDRKKAVQAVVDFVLASVASGDWRETAVGGRVPERETAWLVERQCQPPQYLTGEHTSGWSSDAWRAYRFSTERAADNARLRLPDYLRDESKAVEHMFINKLDSSLPPKDTPNG